MTVGTIVLEASGGYERPSTAFLIDADFPWRSSIPNVADSLGLGKLAKNDRIDAGVLA